MLKEESYTGVLNKRKYASLFFLMMVFIVFYVFFYIIHPLVPVDTDDWQFYSDFRLAIPVYHTWNPTRVFPEMFQAFCGYIAAYIIYPITKDYYNSLVIVNALAVSAAITVYAHYFKNLMERRFNRTWVESILLTTLFLLFHFWILRVHESANPYLFYSDDVTCYYFYLIPNLTASCLVMSLLCNNWLDKNDFSYTKRGFIWLIIYLVLCSNVFCSVLFVSLVGVRVLMKCPFSSKGALMTWLKSNGKSIAIIVFWLFINAIESRGGRAYYLLSVCEHSWLSGIVQSVRHLGAIPMNRIFIFILLLAVVGELWMIIKNRKVKLLTVELFLMFICVLVYEIVLCAKAGTWYLTRADCMFPSFFYILIFLFYKANSLLDRWPRLMAAIPFIILFVYSDTNQTSSTFHDLQEDLLEAGYTIDELKEKNKQVIESIVNGCANGNDSVFVMVPEIDRYMLNWPFMPQMYEHYANALHKHGVIPYKPKGKFIVAPDEENDKKDAE